MVNCLQVIFVSAVKNCRNRFLYSIEEMERAAIVIQNAYRRRDAKKLVANMKKRIREIEEENNAALKIQLAWRRKKGQMVLHMKRRIKAEARDAECWVVLFDYNAGGSYFSITRLKNQLGIYRRNLSIQGSIPMNGLFVKINDTELRTIIE